MYNYNMHKMRFMPWVRSSRTSSDEY